LEIIDRFPDDEKLAAVILTNTVGIDTSESVLAEYQAAFTRFLHKWPNSHFLRRVQVPDDPEELRTLLDSFSTPTQQQRDTASLLAQQIQSGRTPLALLGALLKRTYTEVLIQRAVGPLVAMTPQDGGVGVEVARKALNNDVVADLSAMHVVAELVDAQPLLVAAIDVAFRQVVATEAVARDVAVGADALGRNIAGTWISASSGNPGYFAPVSDIERARVERCARQLEQEIAKHRVVPTPADLTVFGATERQTDISSWDRTIQLAYERGHPLWSDDAITRALARSVGIPSFSTLDLLDVLTDIGRLSPDQVKKAQQDLLARGIADVQLTSDMLITTAVNHGWQTGWAGAALARPEAWTSPADTIQMWIAFIRAVPTERHERVPAWMHLATLGAARTPYVLGPTAARTVISQILSTVVFLTAAQPRIVAG
jgi:hypothetical protein